MKQFLVLMGMAALLCGFSACKSTQEKGQKSAKSSDFIVGQRLNLEELGGRLVESDAYILFTADGRVSGKLGCNTFTGVYTLSGVNSIRFSDMVSTKMMCLDMSVEEELLRVLNTADNYSVHDGMLTLTRLRMAPLAVFKAEKK